ncbi:MAG: hypothetical protein NC048_07040 [Bacteroides sp.]|nr:hypothetical protein [Ruminococcus flavefaciens]MCM1555236.1 hypothetical protein [Bacteroides sp.]
MKQCLLVILLTGLTLNAYSQINVKTDGGIRIGTLSVSPGMSRYGVRQ